ncbi:protein N-acetylglucosaminyltransferase [Aureococcus anophagefferens]|nr:protein N-acetylglucosaminyltransferase [Aureococcus anophagefferens]
MAAHSAPPLPPASTTCTCFWNLCTPLKGGKNKTLTDLASAKDASAPSAEDTIQAQQQFTRGSALHSKEQLHEAIAAYRAAAVLDPTRTDVLYNLANALQDVGQLLEARHVYAKVIALMPDHYAAHYNLGYLHEIEAAIAEYKKAVALDPTSVMAFYNLASAAHALNQHDLAKQYFAKTILLDPHYADAHFNLGIVHQESGVLDEALKCDDEAARLNPDLVEAVRAANSIRANANR